MRPADEPGPLIVRIHPATEPVQGTVERPGGRRVDFVGYMQLIAQIERDRETAGGCASVMEGDRRATSDRPGQGGPGRLGSAARRGSRAGDSNP
jgi:hypothetical protein